MQGLVDQLNPLFDGTQYLRMISCYLCNDFPNQHRLENTFKLKFYTMKNNTLVQRFVWLFLFVSASIIPSLGQETIVVDKILDWGWPIQDDTYGGNSFYWWHRPGKGLNELGDMPTNSWTSPVNYSNGNFYIRFEVIDQPSGAAFFLQMGIWQANGSHENVSDHVRVSGGDGSYVEANLGTPSSWYPVYPGLDFNSVSTFDRIGLALWTDNSGGLGCIPMAQGWTNSAMCDNSASIQGNYFPLQARVIVVACAPGTSFSGWDTYTGGGGTRPPTPSYAIDYSNERTSTQVASTDEYSYNQSSWTSGTGNYLTLTPGQDVYFRVKAAGGNPASYTLTLDVPSRPGAPTFGYDVANQRTSTTVGSDYEYSSSSDMSGATSGTGNYVSFPTGETRYFRKKATGSAFRSNVQTLVGEAGAPPAPAYTIDYYNERTNQSVPSTDEYSYNSNMSGATSGSGSTLTLIPGQDVYFRTKAAGGDPASEIQHLDVPSRPSAPAFTYDAANDRTTQTISSEYEHSANADMSSATTGTGSYVSFSEGTTRYFRKKATGSAFKSQVQALYGGTQTGMDEFVILNAIVDFPNGTSDEGFYFFPWNSNMPANWNSPKDFYNGQVYTRYEIISQVSSEPVGLQFGIWQRLPVGSTDPDDLFENMEEVRQLNGVGSVATNNTSPASWWKYQGGADFNQMNNIWHFGINPYKTKDGNVQIRPQNPDVWNVRNTYWFPMKVRVTVVAVASGSTFSGWQNYIGDQTPPNYQIDFVNERTTATIPATEEYSYNQSTWTTGNNTNLALVPAQDVYFRKKNAPTYVQTLDVPARPSAPSFGIDFPNERTATTVGSEYEYADNSGMSGATTGSGQYVALTPGTSKYFRKQSTASAFDSEIQNLVVPARPAAPAFTVSYTAETTQEIVSADIEYSGSADFSGSASGSGSMLNIAPGTPVYFRKKATASQFRSSAFTLNPPARPTAPTFGINFHYARTSAAISSDYEYATNADLSGAASGANAALNLTPGTDMYFRKKATGSDFRSGVQHLDVPSRPAPPSVSINYPAEKSTEVIASTIHYADNAGFSSAREGTGIAIDIEPGTTTYFRYKSTDLSFQSDAFVLESPERPVVSSQMTDPTADNPMVFAVAFPESVSGFEASDLAVTNGTVGSVTGAYQVNIVPAAPGLVGLTVKANAVNEGNYASETYYITYTIGTGTGDMLKGRFKVYPTQAGSFILIEGASDKSDYQVFDVRGTSVLKGRIADRKQEVNIENLPSGLYQVVITDGDIKETFRFVRSGK